MRHFLIKMAASKEWVVCRHSIITLFLSTCIANLSYHEQVTCIVAYTLTLCDNWKTVRDRMKLISFTNIKSHIRVFDWY